MQIISLFHKSKVLTYPILAASTISFMMTLVASYGKIASVRAAIIKVSIAAYSNR